MEYVAFVVVSLFSLWLIFRFQKASDELDQFIDNELFLRRSKYKLMKDKINCMDCIGIKTEKGKSKYLCREYNHWMEEEYCLQCYRPKAQKLAKKLFNGEVKEK